MPPTRTPASGAKCTSLFWRVRPDHIAGSRFDGPSTSTSSTRPTRAFVLRERVTLDQLREPRHPFRRDLGSDEVVGHVGRGVPGRGEKMKVYAASYCAASTTSSVRAKSSSVSPGEPDDDVGGDREIVDAAAGRRQSREVTRRGVAAVHTRERAITPGLQRQVQVLADRRALGHRRDGLGAEVLRVG